MLSTQTYLNTSRNFFSLVIPEDAIYLAAQNDIVEEVNTKRLESQLVPIFCLKAIHSSTSGQPVSIQQENMSADKFGCLSGYIRCVLNTPIIFYQEYRWFELYF